MNKLVTTLRNTILVASVSIVLVSCGNKPEQNNDGLTSGSKPASPTATAATTIKPTATASVKPSSSLASSTDAGKTMSWTSPPAMKIDVKKTYQAEMQTSKGKITIQLYAKEAPLTVNNFVFLSREKFYNGIIFHRVIKPFMIQTGDPKGNGQGGPGYKFADELKTPYKYEPGTVAMANAGPNTNGSQFFICSGDQCKNLDQQPNYSIFGKVTSGMEVVQSIAAEPVGPSDLPIQKITIDSITIIEK